MSKAAAQDHGRSVPDPAPRSRAQACSVLWDKAGASALGTAPVATFWLALEQNGPWGAQAATESHLDPDLGRTLSRLCQEAGGRFILIRRPGRHPDRPDDKVQRVYVAGGPTERPWLLEADLEDPARLTRLNRLAGPQTQSLANGDFAGVRQALPELHASAGPVLMICANSRRDVCCSVRGRPVAVESASQRLGQVWECSHTGGHRFAPTGVLLPHGQTFARLSGPSAVAALDAGIQDQVSLELLGRTHDRGRSLLSPPGQAAESFAREQIQEPSLLALVTTVTPSPGQENAWHCRVSHVDGRCWDVLAVRSSGGADLPESCGKPAVPTSEWDCKEL